MQNLEDEPSGMPEHIEVSKSGDIPHRGEQPGQIPENPPFRTLSRPWPNRRPGSLFRLGRRSRFG